MHGKYNVKLDIVQCCLVHTEFLEFDLLTIEGRCNSTADRRLEWNPKIIIRVAFPLCNIVKPFLGAFAKLPKANISFLMFLRLSAWNNSAPTVRIFIKFRT